ncbi:MAG: gamma-glutamylcyclotransferase [Alphaproteobacteria bacterium]|nr:MAG: gamma-glutamylcyclotransferase [Alphaproteobacteria bacterium]
MSKHTLDSSIPVPAATSIGAAAPQGGVPQAGDPLRLRPPPGEDFWVFGYGSLMWHPGFPHLEVRPGRLHGYHRHFCVYSHIYRGTPDRPGLVLGLDRGGACSGLVFRVPAAEGEAALDYLYAREMMTRVYRPRWLNVRTPGGPVRAAAFVVDTTHPQYAGRLAPERVVEIILQGRGERGPCLDYLENTVRHLEALGLRDRQLTRLLRMARARCAPAR